MESHRAAFSLRAHRTTDDELGVLVDAFNRMLERIQLRERALDDQRGAAPESRAPSRNKARRLLVRERRPTG
jgi:hypothetical protein